MKSIRYEAHPIPLLPIGAALQMKCTSDSITPPLRSLERIRCHYGMHVRNQRVEPECETKILGCHHQLRKKVRDHFFSNTEMHVQISQTHTTSHQVVANLEMPHIAQSRQIGSNVQTGFGIGIKPIRLRTAEPEEPDHILGVEQLLASNARRHELSRTRRVDYDRLLQGAP